MIDCKQICICAYQCPPLPVPRYTHKYMCMCICVYVCEYICVSEYVYIHMCIHICTYMCYPFLNAINFNEFIQKSTGDGTRTGFGS